MFKDMKIRAKLNLLIVLTILGMGTIGVVSYLQSRSAEDTLVTMVDRDLELLVRLNGLYAEGLQTGQATRNILLNPGDESAKKNYAEANKNFTTVIDEALAQAPDAYKERLKKVGVLWNEDDLLKQEVQRRNPEARGRLSLEQARVLQK